MYPEFGFFAHRCFVINLSEVLSKTTYVQHDVLYAGEELLRGWKSFVCSYVVLLAFEYFPTLHTLLQIDHHYKNEYNRLLLWCNAEFETYNVLRKLSPLFLLG